MLREGEGNPRKEGKGKGKEMGQEKMGIQERGWRRKWIAKERRKSSCRRDEAVCESEEEKAEDRRE